MLVLMSFKSATAAERGTQELFNVPVPKGHQKMQNYTHVRTHRQPPPFPPFIAAAHGPIKSSLKAP